jgi:hypothetical protein
MADGLVSLGWFHNIIPRDYCFVDGVFISQKFGCRVRS